MSKLAKALSASAGNAGGDKLYVEDVFSTYVYTGNETARTIANGIALSDEGGLVWIKSRSNADSHYLFDTVNGPQKTLSSDNTAAGANYSAYWDFPSAGTKGFNLKAAPANYSGWTLASWSFRKQKGFFDCVKFSTTSGGGQQTVSHNLGSIPGTIILKQITAGGDGYWYVFHKSVTSPNSDWWRNYANLNITAAFGDWGSTAGIYSAPTSSGITVSTYFTNQTADFIAYFFAEGGSDDQIFGDDGDEGIIKCGVYTTDGQGNATVNLGFEPQWILSKRTSGTGAWYIRDVMRGMPVDGNNALLSPNTSSAESSSSEALRPSATGFTAYNDGATKTNVYMAIRMPMKTPTVGTEVFNAVLTSSDTSGATGFPITIGFPVDLAHMKYTTLGVDSLLLNRLTGLTANVGQGMLKTDSTAAQANTGEVFSGDSNTGYKIYGHNYQRICYGFKRATGFMDVVCYAGTGVAHNEAHNLGVAPELILIKARDGVVNWIVYSNALGNTKALTLNTNAAAVTESYANKYWSQTSPTSSVFTVGSATENNYGTYDFIAYLWATVAGVSKVGSYTGTGADLNVDCGFTAGARYILIKRTDTTGDWYYWDTIRGINTGNDPYLLMNNAAAQVTNTDYIDPLPSGFTVTSAAPAGLNASSGTYIFLAIA